jgi:hypothetical protein
VLRLEWGQIPWCGPGDGSGVITTKNIYQALIYPLDFQCDKTWAHKLWKWPVQLKIKLLCGWQHSIKSLHGTRSKGKVGKARGFASYATATMRMSVTF